MRVPAKRALNQRPASSVSISAKVRLYTLAFLPVQRFRLVSWVTTTTPSRLIWTSAEPVRLLRAYGFEGHCVITSQSYETLHKVKELAPDIPTGYILALGVGNYYDLPDADFFSVEHTFITSGMVNQIHLRGKTISAWTIAQEDDARHMMELGADDLITDKPDLVHELLRQNAEMDTTLLSLRDAIQDWFFPAPDEEVSDEAEDVIEDVIEDPEEFLDAA